MAWLASGGTDFAYRMSIPVANPASAGDRHIAVPFPAWYLRAKAKIAQSAYQDVHVTKGGVNRHVADADVIGAVEASGYQDAAVRQEGRGVEDAGRGHFSELALDRRPFAGRPLAAIVPGEGPDRREGEKKEGLEEDRTGEERILVFLVHGTLHLSLKRVKDPDGRPEVEFPGRRDDRRLAPEAQPGGEGAGRA